MAYIALYRKYRPQTFSDMVGQENVTRILRNQVKSKKISHAYIFSGTRGTGKTSAAKIFARAINCLNPQDGEPCNECEVCKSILEGNTTDVVEMDAASNNSVENIRQIRQEVIYATIDVKYRVYIIDEAHMLTTSAFNALLKTLEEPPENVIFILATTEKHKIPVTILSRCLRFDFDRLSEEKIANRLKYICDKEGKKYEDKVCEYIAKLADGALRDGISILDRCISEMNDTLKLSEIKSIVGAIDDYVLNNVVENIYEYNILDILNDIDVIISKGKDLRQFVYDLNEKFLERLIVEENLDKKNRTIGIIDRLSKLDNDLRNSSKPSILLKSSMVEICNTNSTFVPNLIKSQNSLVQNTSNFNEELQFLKKKIENIEKELIKIKSNNALQNVTDYKNNEYNNLEKNKSQHKIGQNNDIKEQVSELEGIKPNRVEKSVKNTLKLDEIKQFEFSDEFKKYILQKGNIKIYSSIASAYLYLKDNILVIITANSFAYNILNDESCIKIIKDSFSEKYNKEVTVRIGLNESNKGKDLKIEEIFKKNDINYTSID